MTLTPITKPAIPAFAIGRRYGAAVQSAVSAHADGQLDGADFEAEMARLNTELERLTLGVGGEAYRRDLEAGIEHGKGEVLGGRLLELDDFLFTDVRGYP